MKYITKGILLLMILCLVCGCATTAPGGETTDQPGTQQSPSTTDPDIPVTTADNLLLDRQAKRNEGILPRDIDKDHAWVKAASGNTVTVYYPAAQDAFTYNNGKTTVGETAWLHSLSTEYDITVHAVRKSPASALSAQRLALLSGLQLDLLAFTPAQLPYAAGMTLDATELLEKQEVATDFLNAALLSYGNSGKRYFTPAGVARNLWYLTEGVTSDPLTLSESKTWNLAAFGDFVADRTKLTDGKVAVYGIEAHDYTDFLAALDTPVIAFDTAFTDGSAAAAVHIKALQQIHGVAGRYYNGKSNSDSAPALALGTLAMRYGQTPFVGKHDEYPAFSWAPLPTADGQTGEGTLSACAPILALPKNGSKNEIALNVALLWTARFADANHDLLRFTYGMSFENWEKYYNATNRLIRVVITTETAETNTLLSLVTSSAWDEDKYTRYCQGIAATVKANNERLPQ